MTTDVAEKTTTAEQAGHPDVRRLRAGAVRLWETAAEHRTLAAQIEAGGESDAAYRGGVQRDLAEVASQHAMAYQELANAVDARIEATRQSRNSPQWTGLVNLSYAAIRRAEAHHQRAASVAAHASGNETDARKHEQAARTADERALNAECPPRIA